MKYLKMRLLLSGKTPYPQPAGSQRALTLMLFAAAIFVAPPLVLADPGDSLSEGSLKTVVVPSAWRIDFSGGALYAPSHGADVDLLSAFGFSFNAGVEYATQWWIPLRTELGIYSIGASAWDSTLFRYRAFWGYRLAALTGLRLQAGPGEIDILAGGALSASRYTGLSAVTAYASLVGELRYRMPLSFPFLRGRKVDFFAGIPAEYMFRGTARTLALGLDLGIGLTLSKGASK